MSYDVIVLGLGGMGSAAAYHLARRGRRVLGFDRYPPAHDRGSSHGRARMIRGIYFEHPAYIPLVRRAFELWADLERAAGRPLLQHTGGIIIGAPSGELVSRTLEGASVHALPHEVLDAPAIVRRFPVLAPERGMIGVYDPRTGVLDPEACVRAHLREAAKAGADLHHAEPVLDWRAGPERVEVRTTGGRYEAGSLVVAPGAWAPVMLPDLGLPLAVHRQIVVWLHPAARGDAFEPGRCPVHLWQADGRTFYGFPALGRRGVKVAEHTREEPTTADTIVRTVSAGEVADLRRDFVARYLPAADGEVAGAEACLATVTPDGHFVIDRHPEHRHVVIACGFSGHGFKFTPVVGEILADLALDGETGHDLALFAAGRFSGRP